MFGLLCYQYYVPLGPFLNFISTISPIKQVYAEPIFYEGTNNQIIKNSTMDVFGLCYIAMYASDHPESFIFSFSLTLHIFW